MQGALYTDPASVCHRLPTDFHGVPRNKRDKIRTQTFKLEISASKITAIFFWRGGLVKTVLRFLELVTGENIFVILDVYLEVFL